MLEGHVPMCRTCGPCGDLTVFLTGATLAAQLHRKANGGHDVFIRIVQLAPLRDTAVMFEVEPIPWESENDPENGS